MSSSDIVVLGRLADPYGIRGWLRLYPYGDDPLDWAAMAVWSVGPASGEGPWREYGLNGLKPHGDGLVVLLDGVADRSAAEALKGCLVGAPRASLPAPEDGEFYWADLLGLDVVNDAGERLGRVVGLIETGANDVLRVVDEGGREHLLPFVESVVRTVDRVAGRIDVIWGADW